LVELNGIVVLMGVSLTSLTLLHLAEVEAGRMPFIFWARAPDGTVVRNWGGRCRAGFGALDSELHGLEWTLMVGQSRWRAYDASAALAAGESGRASTPSKTN
jgi:hypothetical protein